MFDGWNKSMPESRYLNLYCSNVIVCRMSSERVTTTATMELNGIRDKKE